MSQQQRPTIEMLDRMFADHFGVMPMMKGSAVAANGGGSVASTESSGSPRTPAHMPLELANFKDASGEKTTTVQNLLSMLASMYVTPAGAANNDEEPMEQVAEPTDNVRNDDVAGRERSNTSSTMASSVLQRAGAQRTHKGQAPTGATPRALHAPLPSVDAAAEKSKRSSGADEAGAFWPVNEPNLHEISKPEDVGNPMARRQSKVVFDDAVRPMGPLTQIHFKMETIPRRACSDKETRDELVTNFPQLCEAPHALMFDDQGVELPPLKYEETSKKEREARKNALAVRVRGKKMHTLIKSMVVLESRSSHWKKVGTRASSKLVGKEGETPVQPAPRGSSRAMAPRLPEVPSPWTMNFMHSDNETLSIKGTARRIFELSESRAYGQCPKCKGSCKESCLTCKGEEPDECFWCDGTGREKRKQQIKCQPCLGTGKLVCKACNGGLQMACRTCDGEGRGEFCAYVHLKVRRVNFAPIPVSNVVPTGSAHDADTVRAAAIERTWESINKLTEASGAKHKHPFRPLAAACALQTSWSDLIEVTMPNSAVVSHAEKISSPMLGSGLLKRSKSVGKSGASARKDKSQQQPQQDAVGKRRYFVVPSDVDLQPAEVDEDEFELAMLSDSRPQTRPTSGVISAARSATSSPARSPTRRSPPAMSTGHSSSGASNHAGGGAHAALSSSPAAPPAPLAASIFGGINPADVAAWQAQIRSASSLHNSMLARPVSPTTQLGSLPGTPDVRADNGAGYFGSSPPTPSVARHGGLQLQFSNSAHGSGGSPTRPARRPVVADGRAF